LDESVQSDATRAEPGRTPAGRTPPAESAGSEDDRSHDIERLLEFIKWNQPGAGAGVLIIFFGFWLTRAPALFALFAAVALNFGLTALARRDLQRAALEPAVVKLTIGLWSISLMLWFSLPRLYGISLIVCVLPIVLAAAYVRREKALAIAVGGVVVAAIGAALHPWRPLLGEVGLPNLMVELLIVVFTPVTLAACALAVWHTVARLLELLEDSHQKNRALVASEQLLEEKVEARTVDLRRSQVELSLARDEALAANRAKSTFLANMSHELRTPLNAIIGYSEMLQEDSQDAGHEQYTPDLEHIVTSGRHLLGLINDVLDLSKIEAGKVDLHAEDLDVAQLLESAAETIRPLVVERGNALELDPREALGSMHSDVTRLRQVLFNLLSNAAKFTSGGTITLSGRREAVDGIDWLVFSVRDTGIGMTRDQMVGIFEAFSQAESTTTRDFGGTGLGLAITRRFCEMLGGSVSVESEPGVGTEFSVRLPARMPSGDAESASESAGESTVATAAAGPHVGATVLVIDDEETARELLRRTLAREGYDVVCASDAEEGLRLAREIRPNLITLDILMPHVDGWSVLTSIKGDPELESIPVIVVTMTDDHELCTALGAAEYMSKPVDRKRLSEVVRKLARGSDNVTVLVVDDDAVTRELLVRTVTRAGFGAVEAENGVAALARLEEETPAAILLDLVMPEMDGFELLSRLRQHEVWRDIPVVVVTAKELTPEEHQELISSAERVLQKGSYDRETLLAEIRRHLDRTLDVPP
jgi:signal transduction histidine kinase/DNA-binding response OmpR family regulator